MDALPSSAHAHPVVAVILDELLPAGFMLIYSAGGAGPRASFQQFFDHGGMAPPRASSGGEFNGLATAYSGGREWRPWGAEFSVTGFQFLGPGGDPVASFADGRGEKQGEVGTVVSLSSPTRNCVR